MPKALIDPNAAIYSTDGTVRLGSRVCQIDETGFPVAEPLFWQSCESSVVPDEVYWDGEKFNLVPPPAPPPSDVVTTQIPNGPTVIS